MGLRRLIREFTGEDETVIIRYLKARGYTVEDLSDDIDKGMYASIYLIDDKKILRVVNEDTGFDSPPPLSLDKELKRYEQLIGDTNDHVVDIYFAGYLPIMDAYIYVLEKLEVIWKDLPYEFIEWYDYMFSDMQLHNKIKDVPNETQLNQIFYQIYNDDYDAKLESFSNLDDGEQQIITDTFRGAKELREKYNIEVTDLHIGNLMKAKNGNYKIIDFGI